MIKNSKEKADMGARIQEIRKKRYMTQEELAEKVGICHAQQMSKIECGKAGLSLERFIDVCVVLDIEADYLLFGTSTASVETVIHKYIEQMTPEQIDVLINLVEVYAKSCGIDEQE